MKSLSFLALFTFLVSASRAQERVQRVITHNGNKTDTIYIMPNDTAHISSFVDDVPQFKGDLETFILKNRRYPADANARHITGSVEVSFRIDSHGYLSNIHVTGPLYPSLDAEALRLVKSMPPWKPAMKNNIPVNGTWFVYIPFPQQP
ncbi:MAG: TonB family protein [Bacteroidetes bacterium]|nr:TonB family protein [Bacteroidota bacterium]